MDHRIAKLAASGAIVGLLGIGGATIASAQDSDTSSTTAVEPTQDDATVAPADDAAPRDGEDCPDKADDTTTDDAS